MKRVLSLFLLTASLWSAPVFQSVEFPFASFPRQYWDRELVWMKNVGIHNVAIDVRSTAEEQDVMLILRTLRKLDLTAWVRLAPAAAGLEKSLEPLRKSHGGPILYLGSSPPEPVARLSAMSPAALSLSRAAISSKGGTLLWSDVEETFGPEYHRGAISFAGEESPTITALRRDALLLGYWQEGLSLFQTSLNAESATGPLPEGVSARQLFTADHSGPSVVSITNNSKAAFRGDLRVGYPPLKHNIALPGVDVPAGESLLLPVNIPLAKGPFCRNCDALGNEDSIVYATAELTGAEHENGILALEFAAPAPGEVVVHLSQSPSGPLVAGGKPRTFDWDAGSGRARLPIPAGRAPGFRVRIALALEPPDNSAFFEDRKVLIIGQPNIVPTSYSSEAIASRSRLRAPANLKFEAIPKGPLSIDYSVTVPPDALHGDHVDLSLEADGVQMGHTRLQLLRAASIRIREEVKRHFGTSAELAVFPSLVPMDQRAGRNISLTVRNNFPEIKTYVLELSGDGLEFSPAKTEVTIAASSERDVSVRIFPKREDGSGPLTAVARLSGAAAFELPVRLAIIPRGQTISYAIENGFIMESARARAIFADNSKQQLMEFTWKDSERNVLPEGGINFGSGNRKVTLEGAELTIEQDSPLPPEKLKPGKRNDLTLTVQRPSPNRAIYAISR
jgi:hypothetical protein